MNDRIASPRALERATLRSALRRFERRIIWGLIYYNAVLAGGTLGYRVLEGWNWLDSLYMSVITATSVGFAEVHPLSDAGRVFTIALLIFSIIGLGLLWAMITALFVELDLAAVFRKRRTMKRIEELSNHYLVCGAGRMGNVVIGELERAGVPFVVVDSSREKIEKLREGSEGLLAVEGDATRAAVLEAAGIARAKGMAATLSSDADNVFLCLTAREMNADLEIAARAVDEETVAKLHRAGAQHVISANITGGARIATMLLRPAVVSFLDAATVSGELSLRLEEMSVPSTSFLVGKRLHEARIPQETGLIVLAVHPAEAGAPPVFNPGPETALAAGDTLIVLGEEAQVDRLRQYAAG